jgi:hypothetical protein
MADRQIDPARLRGEALRKWYLRSPAEIEQERQAADAQRHNDFFGADRTDSSPGFSSSTAAPGKDLDPGVNRGSGGSPDEDAGLTWIAVGPNRWRSQRTPVAQLMPLSRSVGVSVSPDNASTASGQHTTKAAAQPTSDTSGLRSPLDMAQDALHDFQSGPKIPRPNLAESFIPIVGPAWEAAGDLQDGNYGGAAFNAAMAVGDALPLGAVFKGAKAAEKGIGILKKGSVSAGAAAKQIRKAGLAGTGEEIHHSIPLNGASRSAQDWRNHYAFLKTLPQETHRRLTGSWNGKPQFDPIRRLWYGTTDWQKSVPAAIGSYAADAWENLTHPFGPPSPPEDQTR